MLLYLFFRWFCAFRIAESIQWYSICLVFEEFEQLIHQAIFVSATPGDYELEKVHQDKAELDMFHDGPLFIDRKRAERRAKHAPRLSYAEAMPDVAVCGSKLQI